MLSRFGKSAAARKLSLVQIAKEVLIIMGVSKTLSQSLFMAGAVAAFFRDYVEGLRIRTAG